MKPRKNFSLAAGTLILTGFLSACGTQAYREPTDSFSDSQTGGLNGSGGGTVDTGGTEGTGSTGSGSPSISSAFSFQGASGSFTSPAVYTDTILKVKIIPNVAPVISGSYGYTPIYNCISYNVTVLGKTVRTAVLRVGANSTNCPNAPTEQVLDFSDRLSPGHSEVTVKISEAQTDWKYASCVNSGPQPMNPWLAPNVAVYACSFYQTMNNLYTTHSATGTLEVSVNGTN